MATARRKLGALRNEEVELAALAVADHQRHLRAPEQVVQGGGRADAAQDDPVSTPLIRALRIDSSARGSVSKQWIGTEGINRASGPVIALGRADVNDQVERLGDGPLDAGVQFLLVRPDDLRQPRAARRDRLVRHPRNGPERMLVGRPILR